MQKFFDDIYPRFESFIIVALTLTLMIMIVYASFVYIATLINALVDPGPIAVLVDIFTGGEKIKEPIKVLQHGLFQIFGGFLLILLGFELIGTVKVFAKKSHIKIESIVVISIIATARHLITMDYHHTPPLMIFAMGFVVFCLIVGYFLLKTKSLHTTKKQLD